MNDALISELQRIHDRDGMLVPDAVVNEAADPASPLHEQFTWDDSEAADKWRLTEARTLIRKAKIKIVKDPDTIVNVRAYVSVNHDGQRGYMRTEQALEVHKDQVFEQAIRDVAALRRRYQSLVEFDEVLRAVLAQERAA